MADDVKPGLSSTPEKDWPKLSKAEAQLKPIDRLKPGSDLHAKVLGYLVERLDASERAMGAFYPRWRWNESRVQAYVELPKYEQMLKEASKNHEPPKITSIVLPYSFATLSTIVTYLIQAFCGRKPMFQVSTFNDELMPNAKHIETMLQYNADHERLVKHLFQFFNDGELYGLSVLRTQWKQHKAKRSKFIEQPKLGWLSLPFGSQKIRIREDKVIFEGSEIANVDPFLFFPDPRVPMNQVNRKGEFVFWRSFEGKHTLKKMEEFKWVDNAGSLPVNLSASESSRALLSGGEAIPGGGVTGNANLLGNTYQIDEGTVDIIPAELGLGEGTGVERWLFTIANKHQIIRATPIELDHGMHPVIVSEPYTMGYGFGQAGISDYLGPVQDAVSWFINSHIHNVRSALNNMFIVDPSMVEMQDLKNPNASRLIRLKRSAYGKDVREAVSQLAVADVTRGHVADLDAFMRIGDALSSVNDNLRGLQDSGGRKSATEARTSAEAAASRLASHAKLISSQAIIDLAEQMTMNYQQFMSDAWFVKVLGKKAGEEVIRISPDMLGGDFIFPVNDGTLPLDRVALLDVWKQILEAVLKSPQLQAEYSVGKLFAYVADLGGAKNLESMKVLPQEQIAAGVQAGNLVPTAELGGGGGQAPGTVPNPGDRLAGALG